MARILLIDNDDAVRGGLGRYLRTLGHDVLEAQRGGEGLRLASRLRVDLVVTDLGMPDVDGMEIIMALRGSAPGAPIIAMAGGGIEPKERLLAHAAILGAVATVAKPFEYPAVGDAVTQALGRHRAEVLGGAV